MLIALAGLPGSGKTTFGRALAQRLDAVYLRIDTLEQAMKSCGLTAAEIGPAGYAAAAEVAVENLRLGRSVVVDSVNPIQLSRDGFRDAAARAGAKIVEIEIICSDSAEHRRRVETRVSDIEGLHQPSWAEVQARDYHPWDRPPLVVDTAMGTLDTLVADVIERLQAVP